MPTRLAHVQGLTVPDALLPGLSALCTAHQALEIHFLLLQGFDHDGLDLHWSWQT